MYVCVCVCVCVCACVGVLIDFICDESGSVCAGGGGGGGEKGLISFAICFYWKSVHIL